MWEHEVWHCMMCGWTLKFGLGRNDVDKWCMKCHEPLEKVKEVKKNG